MYILINPTSLLQSDLECKKISRRDKKQCKKSVFKASFDPLLRVFCRKLVFRGATLHGEKQDAERRQNEIKEGKEGGERRRKKRRFQWMSEFLGCSAAELMTGAYVRDTQLQSHNQPAEERRDRKKVLSWEGDAGWGGWRRHLEILLPSLLFLVLSPKRQQRPLLPTSLRSHPVVQSLR